MPMWGEMSAATHLSDNEFVCDKDMHMLPFDGIIKFNKTACELVKYDRNVTLMLEIKPNNHKKYADISIKDYYTVANQFEK